MEDNIKEKEIKNEIEKLKKIIKEKQETEKAQNNSEKASENISKHEVKPSSSTNTASSRCSLLSSSMDVNLEKPKTRKRKLSQSSSPSGKKVKYNNKKKNLIKRIKRKHSDGDRYRRESKNERKKSFIRKSEDRYSEKSCRGNENEDQAYKKDYNKKLDCLAKYGKNFYCPSVKRRTGLRPIYIDGSNVAFSHGENEKFSVKGLKICIDYFRKRGHEVKAFVPHFRLRKGETTDQQLMHKLFSRKLVITTPTLYIQNQRRSPYDDWYIIQSAAANGGIIISADNFQDIIKWNPNLRSVIEERRLVPTFVGDMIIFPVDPHGNRQNNLEQFLRF